ncbi:hypothetical protein GE061_018179 [Apolygus lucorum]|uniref:Uncharacterized protein n=1 Tax=Apolygus lucorum TaxID=248454 RepID=A0A8S9XDA1_APOLU|nr:hypothetical protein GE061_018179 [Apolygus lucorum]
MCRRVFVCVGLLCRHVFGDRCSQLFRDSDDKQELQKMPHRSYDVDLIQKLLEVSVMKMIQLDRDPDPPMLKHVLIMNLLKRAGVPNGLLYRSNHRDDGDLPSDAKYRKLNDGSAEGTRESSDSLPMINVSGLINHIAEGLPLIP